MAYLAFFLASFCFELYTQSQVVLICLKQLKTKGKEIEIPVPIKMYTSTLKVKSSLIEYISKNRHIICMLGLQLLYNLSTEERVKDTVFPLSFSYNCSVCVIQVTDGIVVYIMHLLFSNDMSKGDNHIEMSIKLISMKKMSVFFNA